MEKFLGLTVCAALLIIAVVLLTGSSPVQGFFTQTAGCPNDWQSCNQVFLPLLVKNGPIDEATPVLSPTPSPSPTPTLTPAPTPTQTPSPATPTPTPFPMPTPVTVPQFSRGVDCETKNYKMGFILVVKNPEDAAAQLPGIDSIKNAFPDAFSQATKGLTSIDTSNDVLVMTLTNSMLNPIVGQYEINPIVVAQEFYKTRGDTYDFLTIFTAFPTDVSGAYHIGLVNNIAGIGLGLYDISFAAGSNGKLKGIIFMGEPKMIVSRVGALNLLLHETGHQWGIYAGDQFTGKGGRLEIKDTRAHWYRGVRSSYPAGDPLGADYWVMNQDGSYRRENQIDTLQQYHDFMLYFMGLLPPEKFSEKHQILNAGVPGIDFNPKRAVPYKEVSVNDIIAVEGAWKCYLPQ